MAKIKSVNITSAIMKELYAYEEDISNELEEIASDVAEQGVNNLENIGDFEDGNGTYRRGFGIAFEKTPKGFNFTLKNECYQLTHLLENGHATSTGGRTRAFKHWEPTQKQVKKEYLAKVKERLKR